MSGPAPLGHDDLESVMDHDGAPPVNLMGFGTWRALMSKAGASEEEINKAEVMLLRGFIAGRDAALRALAERWEQDRTGAVDAYDVYDLGAAHANNNCAAELRALLGDDK